MAWFMFKHANYSLKKGILIIQAGFSGVELVTGRIDSFLKRGFVISCKLSPDVKDFLGQEKKIRKSSAELAQRVVKINDYYFLI